MRRFKGGSIKRRDTWFGLEKKPDFIEFKRWYHRAEKPSVASGDLNSASEAQGVYDEWVALGRPNMR